MGPLNLLLDTHILLWWLAQDARLTKRAQAAITDADKVYVSAASAWEIAIKITLGKLRAPDDLKIQMDASGFLELPISIAHAAAAGKLPPHHTDPFDRLLIAQAELESLTLLTSDRALKAYGDKVLFA